MEINGLNRLSARTGPFVRPFLCDVSLTIMFFVLLGLCFHLSKTNLDHTFVRNLTLHCKGSIVMSGKQMLKKQLNLYTDTLN